MTLAKFRTNQAGAKRRLIYGTCSALAFTLLFGAPASFGADGTVPNTTLGALNWSDTSIWTGGVVADGAGSTANFNQAYGTGDKVMTIDVTSRTLGKLIIGDTNTTYRLITIQSDGSTTLTLNNNGAGASISKPTTTNPLNDIISVPVILADNLAIDMTDVTSGSNLTLSGNISETAGARNLTKTGAGLVTLTGANTYTGTTTISAGTLRLGNNSATGSLSPSSAIVNNATLNINRTTAITQGTDFGIISGTGAITKNSTGTLTLNAANSYDGVTSISTGIVIAANNTALGTTTGNTSISTGGSLQLQGGITMAENLVTTGQGSGVALNLLTDLSPAAPGAVRSLAGANTLTGTITLRDGGGASLVLVDSGSTLDLQGNVGIISGGSSRALFVGGDGPGKVSGALVNNFGGSAALSVQKIGTGTWTFANTNNTYTGTTTVSEGTLLVQGNLTNATGNVSVNTGTLGGTGSIAKIVNVGDGVGTLDAILAPGVAGIGTLTTTNNINFLSDAVFALQINTNGTPSTDLLTTSGVISLGAGIATLSAADLGNTVLSSGTLTFLSGSSITGNFAGLPDGSIFSIGANQFEINYTPTSVELQVSAIPEPGSIALFIGAAATLYGVCRHRRRNA